MVTLNVEAVLRTTILIPAICFLTVGCVQRDVHLYPANDKAQQTGVMLGSLLGHGNLHGTIEAQANGGELFKGYYSIVAGGGVGIGFGAASVTGAGGTTVGSGLSTLTTISAGGNGQADLSAPSGAYMHCDFQNNNLAGHGFGNCQRSDGAIYRLNY